MSKKTTIITIIVIIVIAALYYWINQSTKKNSPSYTTEGQTLENVEIVSAIECPPDNYDWKSLHSITEQGLTIECPIDDNQTLTLKAKQAFFAPSNSLRPIYKIYVSRKENELLLDNDYGMLTTGGAAQFTATTLSNGVIHLYTRYGDSGGHAVNGWFVDTGSNKFAEYSSNGRDIDITTNNSTYNINYAIQDGDDSQHYGIATGRDIVILGLKLNGERVISFDQTRLIEYDSSEEIAPYSIPDIDINLISSSLDNVSVNINSIGKFNIPLKN